MRDQWVNQSTGLIGYWAWWVLDQVATPLQAAHFFLKHYLYRRSRPGEGWNWDRAFGESRNEEQNQFVRRYVDGWHLWCLGIGVYIWLLFALCPGTWWPKILAIFPLLRMAQLPTVLWYLFAAGYPIRSVPRSVAGLFVHYIEILVAFAIFYLTTQAFYSKPIFLLNEDGRGVWLTAVQAFDFSFGTASTIGSGIVPAIAELRTWPLLVVRYLEWMFVLFVVLVSFPRWLKPLPHERHPPSR